MNGIIERLDKQLGAFSLPLKKKPILIGGMAKEYYGIRKSGPDIDLVICGEDYQTLAQMYPDNRKDIWGDLGVVLGPLEIWRSIMLLDYDFYRKDAIDEGIAYVVSLDRLLLMCVFGMGVDKYMNDLKLLKDYYHRKCMNPSYCHFMEEHGSTYKSVGGVVYGGNYTHE